MNRSVDASRDLSLPSPDGPNELALGPDGSLPPDCRIIAERATPITDALARAGKNSLGMVAEGLIKLLGARSGGSSPGSSSSRRGSRRG